ncbi:unnamed protein product [Allacma fusca]|uniref:Protein kinase domain-containing protein n=1 Tax=Allacma fusca TaxID=39272 RepID=A0A8J2JY48_9HEXA|nr:unnamed protein product [Allacma fusca]
MGKSISILRHKYLVVQGDTSQRQYSEAVAALTEDLAAVLPKEKVITRNRLVILVERNQQRSFVAAFELSPFGNLSDYLKQNAGNYVSGSSEEDYSQETIPPRVSVGTEPNMDLNQSVLISFCKQIATAMAYIAEKKVVHRDLSAHNILVFHYNVVKITDFGMSRTLYESKNYVERESMSMQWNWMALESLRYMEFSTKSDVWSFAVTIWEIFSLGEMPYSDLIWTPDLVDKTQAGLRLSKPDRAPPEVFDQMKKCWQNNPEKRPTFLDCQEFFTDIQSRVHRED